jgi:hypothetical protein
MNSTIKHPIHITADDDEFEKHKKLPIYKQSLLIRKLTRLFADGIDEENDDMNLEQLMLENAFSIKRYANELDVEIALCESKDLGNMQYLPQLKKEIEKLRTLFIHWVDSFDKTKDVEDDWALWRDYGGE